jgi:MraZ protein
MFMGEYEHTLDEKNRIIIPTKLREELGKTFVITRGTDGCLFIYPEKAWEEFVNQLKQLPGNKEGREMQRYFMAGAAGCEADKQGRVMIPQRLLDAADIEKEVVSVGVIDKIEVWSKERWGKAQSVDSVDDMADHMAEFGLKF